MYVHVCMCAYTCLLVQKPEDGWDVLYHPARTLFRQSFPESSPQVFSASLEGSKSSYPSVSPPSELDLLAFGETTGLLHGRWDLNSAPHNCKASTLNF